MEQSSHIHSTSNRYSPTRTNIFLTQANHRGKQFIPRPPTQMEKDIEYYIKGLNTLIKKMANIEDQLADYAREFEKKRTEFIGMEKQAEERIDKMQANTRILNGKVAAVLLAHPDPAPHQQRHQRHRRNQSADRSCSTRFQSAQNKHLRRSQSQRQEQRQTAHHRHIDSRPRLQTQYSLVMQEPCSWM